MLLAVVQTWPEGSEPTDASLMERVLERDAGALETLYDRYARLVYSLVLRISQQPTSAEEIVQDVFLQLWRNAKRYQAARGPLEPWLFTVARNKALDFLRLKREKQRRAIELAFFEGMTHSEISAAIGEPLGTVKSWIRGGLLRLRESLEEARS